MAKNESTPQAVKELNIHERLLRCMEDVGYVQKEDKKVNNQYSFVSHDAVVRKVRGALIKHGVTFTTVVRDFKVNGNRCELILDCTFTNTDKPEDSITTSSIGFGIDNQDKGPGKAMSYAKKYALLQALLLETGDDPERDMIEHVPAKSTNGPKGLEDLTGKDVAKAEAYLKSIGWLKDDQCIDELKPEHEKQIDDNWDGFRNAANI